MPTASDTDLHNNAESRYGCLDAVGPAIRQRLACGYFSPDEHYECLVSRLVSSETKWLDIGCGRDVFPGNAHLANELSKRCQLLIGIDPDETIHENRYVHQRVQSWIEDYHPDVSFDLVTLRMVAEHIADPGRTIDAISRLCAVGGQVIIYTVNKWSLTAAAARFTPFRVHHLVKNWLWSTEEKDTFPVQYRMNTKQSLERLFHESGFETVHFEKLCDVIFWRFRLLGNLELKLLGFFRATKLPYFDTCILASYRRTHSYLMDK